jgi:DNA-binding MltR family transcriptional regulator
MSKRPNRARWQVFDIAHAPIIVEIEKQSDRGAAIVATAFLEERLNECIRACLADDPQIIKNLFRGSGPLAALATKIDLGYLLGIYRKRMHRQLITIRDIRNKFAHHTRPLSFTTEDVAALCRNLPAPRRLRPPRIPSEEQENKLYDANPQAWAFMWFDWINSGKDTPRNRFLIAVRMNYLWFSTWLRLKEKTGEVPKLSLPGK